MKKLLALLLSVGVLLTMVSCGAPAEETTDTATAEDTSQAEGGDDAAATDEPVNITWMHHFAEENKQAWAEAVVAATEEMYPHITVTLDIQPMDRYSSLLKTKIQGDDAPAVFDLIDDVQDYYDAGYLVDLSGEEWFATLKDSAKASGIVAGGEGSYAAPASVGGFAVFYNKGMFEENGYAVPTVYSEWISLLETIEADGIAPIAAGSQESWTFTLDLYTGIIGSITSKNPTWVADKMSGAVPFTGDAEFEAEMKRFYDRMQFTQDDPFGTDWNKATDLLATGEAAMVVGASFAADAVISKNPDALMGAFPLPIDEDPDNTRMPSGATGGFVVYNGEQQDAGLALIGQMFSPEMAAMYQTEVNVISSVIGVDAPLSEASNDLIAIEDSGMTNPYSGEIKFIGEHEKVFADAITQFIMDGGEFDITNLVEELDSGFAAIQ